MTPEKLLSTVYSFQDPIDDGHREHQLVIARCCCGLSHGFYTLLYSVESLDKAFRPRLAGVTCPSHSHYVLR